MLKGFLAGATTSVLLNSLIRFPRGDRVLRASLHHATTSTCNFTRGPRALIYIYIYFTPAQSTALLKTHNFIDTTWPASTTTQWLVGNFQAILKTFKFSRKRDVFEGDFLIDQHVFREPCASDICLCRDLFFPKHSAIFKWFDIGADMCVWLWADIAWVYWQCASSSGPMSSFHFPAKKHVGLRYGPVWRGQSLSYEYWIHAACGVAIPVTAGTKSKRVYKRTAFHCNNWLVNINTSCESREAVFFARSPSSNPITLISLNLSRWKAWLGVARCFRVSTRREERNLNWASRLCPDVFSRFACVAGSLYILKERQTKTEGEGGGARERERAFAMQR